MFMKANFILLLIELLKMKKKSKFININRFDKPVKKSIYTQQCM